MYKKIFTLLGCLTTSVAYGTTDDLVAAAQEFFNATKIVCSGISDEIAKVSNISKVNTVVTTVGTASAGGALYAGIKKSQEEQEIDDLIKEMCNNGGCTPEGVRAMSDADFMTKVIEPFARIAELKEHIEKSKNLGNWRTGLMAGTIGTNLASAIISGINKDQSELIQHVSACNEMLESVDNLSAELRKAGINPNEVKVVKDINNIKVWCGKINVSDIEKIENRMTWVMGTSIAGSVFGVVGTATSAAANSDKYTSLENRTHLSEQDKEKKDTLNTTANVMAGANVATGLVETGFNISLIKLTKDLIKQAERCEEVLK